jgi:hypothetical protein
VFVDDDFEFVRDFWFPTKQSKWVTGKNGQGELDTSLASITLAEIPFVRMRKSLDPSLISAMANYSFSQTVAMLNASYKHDVDVVISKSSLLISVLGIDIKLTAKDMACYLWLYNKGQIGLKVDRDFEDNTRLSHEFLCCYAELASDPRVFERFHTTPEDFREGNVTSITGMPKEFLQPICSNINNKLKKALPNDISSKLLIESDSKGSDHYYRVALTQLSHQPTIVD